MQVYYHHSRLHTHHKEMDADTLTTMLTYMGRQLMEAAELRCRGILPADATVWINGDNPTMGMHVLSERSTLLRIYRTFEPGWARLSRKDVRWGLTSRESQSSPSNVTRLIDPRSLTTDTDTYYEDGTGTHNTLVILHEQPSESVRFVSSAQVTMPSGGQVSYDPWTVIDGQQYVPPTEATRNAYQRAQAMIDGIALLKVGQTPERKRFIENNVDHLQFEMNDTHCEAVYKISQSMLTTAHRLIQEINTKLRENNPDLSLGSPTNTKEIKMVVKE